MKPASSSGVPQSLASRPLGRTSPIGFRRTVAAGVVTLPSPTAAIEEQARAFGLGKLDSNSTCTYYYRQLRNYPKPDSGSERWCREQCV
jgi:hypothetical protein